MVTNAVLAQTKTPILILRQREAPPADSLKVGIAVDGSKFGREAVKYVLRHQDLFGAKPQFTLIHAVADFAGALMPDMAGIALPAYSEEDIRAMQKKAFDSAVGPVRKLFQKAGVTPTEVCLAGKQVAAGEYGECRLRAEATFVINDRVEDYEKAIAECDERFLEKFALVEAQAGGACPTEGDAVEMMALITGDTNAIATGGTRELQYKLTAGEAGWVLQIDRVVDR